MALKERDCPDCWRDQVVVTCDRCGRQEEPHGNLDKVVPWLRKQGWGTVPGASVADPMGWACPNCLEAK